MAKFIQFQTTNGQALVNPLLVREAYEFKPGEVSLIYTDGSRLTLPMDLQSVLDELNRGLRG